MELTDETITGPSILKGEVEKAIKRLKNKKAPGPDNIHSEVLKLIDENGVCFLTELFNRIYDTGTIPSDWLHSTFITIPKKNNAVQCSDFRTISLMSQALKAFLYIIHERIYPKLEQNLGETQFGFRNGLGTRDALFGLQVLLQRCRDYNITVYLCFIDFEKAFDKVKHNRLIEVLHKHQVDDKDARIICNLYMKQKASVMFENQFTDEIEIKRGVRQGCVLSPLLFNAYSEEIFKEALDDVDVGIVVNGEKINNMRYADDTVVLASTPEGLQFLLNRINAKCNDYGLKLNTQKTKYMVVSRSPITDMEFKISNENIDRVENFRYLGCQINDKIDHTIEIRCRIEQARSAFIRMKKVLCSRNIHLNLRVRLARCFVFSVLLYGVEAATISATSMKRLEAFELWVYRRMLKISWTDRISNETVLNRMRKEKEIAKTVKSRKLSYFGHIMRNMNKYRILHNILQGTIARGRRPPGRRQMSWMKNLRQWYGQTNAQLFRSAVDRVKVKNMIANMMANVR